MPISSDLKVQATTLGDVYYPFIAKFQADSKYLLIASSGEVGNITEEWKSNHVMDVPLYRISNFAFTSKDDEVSLPLFLQKSDAISSYERLNKDKDNYASPKVTLTSIIDVIKLWERGGVDGSRALEIFPSIDSIEKARMMMSIQTAIF